MLCRTGLVWKSTVDDQVLTFRLIGVNNQNFIMEDEQTGSWWQQVTGEAIAGPLAGTELTRLQLYGDYWLDWKRFNPDGALFAAGLFGKDAQP